MEIEQWRTKSPIAQEEEIKREAKEITREFIQFTEGYHVMFLIQRHKDGGGTNNTKLLKIVTKNSMEFEISVRKLLHEYYMFDKPLRIYYSCNVRDIKKAIRKFRFEQLDAESYGEDQYNEFYLDVKNRFIGCLMQPGSKGSSYFLWDIDTPDDGEFLKVLPPEIPIVLKYKSKKGWHIITHAFNHTKMALPKDVEIHTDGLLLLKF